MKFMNKQESSPPTCKTIKNEYLRNKYSTMENSFSIFIFKLNENVKLHFILLTNYYKNHLEAQNYYDLKKKKVVRKGILLKIIQKE